MLKVKTKKEFLQFPFTKNPQYEAPINLKKFFSALNENISANESNSKILSAAAIETPLGALLAIGDKKYLYFLEFVDWRGLSNEIERLRKNTDAMILPGETPPLVSIKKELQEYFKGKLKRFRTPLYAFGTLFQKDVWMELKKIPYGDTRSYCDVATLLGKPTAYRAVANANGKNPLAIVVPCHRVINHNGALGGYGGGLPRKKWLLEHEFNNLGKS